MEELKITVNGKTYDVIEKETEIELIWDDENKVKTKAIHLIFKENNNLIYDAYYKNSYLIYAKIPFTNPEIVEKILDQL